MTHTTTNAPVWEPRGKGLYCPAHKKSFATNATCAACDQTLWEAEGYIDITAPIEAPPGLQTLEEHERACTDEAVRLERKKPSIAFKYRALAIQLANQRERRERTTRLARHEKWQAGLRH